MNLTAIIQIISRMSELKEQEKIRIKEAEETLQELARLQKRLASLEQDISELRREYHHADEELRPNMAEYLKYRREETEPDEILA